MTRLLAVPLDESDVFLMTFMILQDSYIEPTRVGSDSPWPWTLSKIADPLDFHDSIVRLQILVLFISETILHVPLSIDSVFISVGIRTDYLDRD